jgi:predicted Zn-dependent protease
MMRVWPALGALVVAMALAPGAERRAEGDAKSRAQAEKLVREGDTQVLMGDDAAARALYEQAVAADPDYAHAVVRLAFVEARMGNDGEAVKRLEELTAKPDAPAEAFQILGTVQVKRREWKRAVAAFETYLAKVPADYGTRRELARAYAALAEEGGGDAGAKAKAVAAYERAIADAGDDASFKTQSQEELFVAKYGPSGRGYLEGRTAYANGDYRGAVRKLEQVTTEHPEIEEAHYYLGLAHLTPEINRRADALKAFERAPKVKESQLHLGMELHADGDLAGAEKRVQSAIALDRNYQEAWYYLGVIAAERGDVDAAARAGGRPRQIDPQSETGKWAATKYSMMTAQGMGPIMEGAVVDPATETAMGQKFEEMAISYFGGRMQDDRLQERLEKTFDRLVAATDRGDLTYHLILVNTSEINAFSAPGGRIFLTRGLLDTVRTRLGDRDEYYAAVLGHELAHSTLRHTPEKWKFVQTVVNDPKASKAEVEQAMASVAVGMTRQQEYEADQYGALYMYRAGYNPRYAMELHVQFKKVLGEIPPGLDHPTFEDRAARLKDFLIELRGRVREFERGNKKFREGDYAGAARSYEIFLAVVPRNAPGHMNLALAKHRQALVRLGSDQRYKRATDIDPDARVAAIELHSADKPTQDPRIDKQLLREAAAEYKTTLRLDPSYTLARVNYAALLLDTGDVKGATQMLEKAVKAEPKNALAWNNLGVAYAMNKNKKAVQALETATKLDPKLPDPWFNLAVVEADAGHKEKAMAAYAKYAELDPDSGWSRKAKKAKAELAAK